MKQVIIVRNDLGLSTGKLVTQACHAAVLAYRDVDATGTEEKVVVHTDGPTLMKRRQRAKDDGVPYQLVQDARKEEREPRTITALAVGPAADDAVDPLTDDLPLVDDNPNSRAPTPRRSDTRPE
ncbi:MAG: peptidyl-tRNA hydrolase [Haloferacaceae archaeon]